VLKVGKHRIGQVARASSDATTLTKPWPAYELEVISNLARMSKERGQNSAFDDEVLEAGFSVTSDISIIRSHAKGTVHDGSD